MNPDPVESALALLMDIKLPVQIALGRTRVPLAEVLRLSPGALVELDSDLSSGVEIVVHDKVIATGEIVDVDGDYGIRIVSRVAGGGGLNFAPSIEGAVSK